MKVADYLGGTIAELLVQAPFSGWRSVKSVDDDLTPIEVKHEFPSHHFEVICDGNGRIVTMFFHAGVEASIAPIPLGTSRAEVRRLLGPPSKTGPATQDSVLGPRGAWERFEYASHTLHVEYRPDADEIRLVTLMTPDVVP